MTLHKLTAGDGYTYLTRQVAAADSTERGYTSLGDYYAARGESPGRWTGRGLASLGTSGTVSERQMRNLFGMGIHPDAERIQAQLVAQGLSVPAAAAAARLGQAFPSMRGRSSGVSGSPRRTRTGTRRWAGCRGSGCRRRTGPGSAPTWPGRCSPSSITVTPARGRS